MSLDVRYLTDEKETKKIYRIVDSGAETFDIYEKLEDVPHSIRNYAEHANLQKCGPDLARIFGVLDYFYPNFPKCNHELYKGMNCIAEACTFADPDYEHCPYFKNSK